MSGPGRRRKPNPDEEGSLPAPPRPPAGYPQQAQQQQPPQGEGQGYAYGYEYNRENYENYDGFGNYEYDWRQPQSQSQRPGASTQPDAAPGPVFDAFSPSQSPSPPTSAAPPTSSRPRVGVDQQSGSSYYNPVGYGLSDPYSPAGYGVTQPPTSQPPTQQPQPPVVPTQSAAAPPQTAPATPHPAPTSPQSTPTPPQPTPTLPPTSSPPPTLRPSASPPGSTFPSEPSGLFDEDDLFDTGSTPPASAPSSSSPSASLASSTSTSAPTNTNPVVPPPAADAPRPNDGYSAADFAFLEEDTGHDVKGWLTFVESRKDSRADRLRRFRMQLIAIVASVVVVVAGIGAYFLFSGGTLGASAPAKSAILLQISNSTGNAVADALLVTDSSATSGTGTAKTVTGKGSAVLIPSQLEVNTTGFGLQPFGGDMAQSVPAADKETVADTFGVTVDGVWRMDEVTFAGLIDEIGGIKLTANAAVPAVTVTPTAAAIPAGAGKLTGGQAIAYGTYAAKGEAPGAQSDRFGQVVAALLAALPNDAVAVTSYLNHLGIVDDPALPESKLSPILAALATEQQAGAFTAKVLPVRTDGSNELDFQAAAPIVSSLLGGALTAGAPGKVSRVLVEDATGSANTRSQAVRGAAQAKLANSGYTFLDGSTVAVRTTSVVEVGSDAQKDAAVQIAETLGLQAINVKVVSGMSTFSDVTVILGTDWPKLANVNLPAN